MKLWLVSQDQNDGYDTYDAFVCVAPDWDSARRMIPGYDDDLTAGSNRRWSPEGKMQERVYYPPGGWEDSDCCHAWAYKLDAVKAVAIGDASDATQRIVIASFHAG
jgi:hypothetical protein